MMESDFSYHFFLRFILFKNFYYFHHNMSSINPIEPIDSIDDSKSGQELILLADIQKDIRELQNGVKENCNFLQMRLIIEEVRWQLTAVENTYKSNTQQWSKMLGLQAEVSRGIRFDLL
ncbi:hypothetical protein PS15p_201164 [Mucor circinelloides]